MPVNTTAAQDRIISQASEESHITDLISIIEDLDLVITDWKGATDCDDPEDARSKIALLQTELSDAETLLREAREEIVNLNAQIDDLESGAQIP